MTQPSARQAVYSGLMWPEWNPQTEAHGTSYEHAQQLLDAHAAEVRAAVLREAATVFRADAEETARAARASYDPDMARAAKQLAAGAARLDRMAEEKE
jgi:hypothetical protein